MQTIPWQYLDNTLTIPWQYLDAAGKVPAMRWGRGKMERNTPMKAELITQYSWLNSFRFGWFWRTRPCITQYSKSSLCKCAWYQLTIALTSKAISKWIPFFRREFTLIYPVRIEDKDGAEAEDEEGGGQVDHPNYCPGLKFHIHILPFNNFFQQFSWIIGAKLCQKGTKCS